MMKKIFAIFPLLAALLSKHPLHSFEKGDTTIGLSVTAFVPNYQSPKITGDQFIIADLKTDATIETDKVPNPKARFTPRAKDAIAPELKVSHMWTDHLSTELSVAATHMTLDLQPNIVIITSIFNIFDFFSYINLSDIHAASTWILPTTCTLRYHFFPCSEFQPYLGLGVNYTHFFNEKLKHSHSHMKLSLDDSYGIVGQVGLNYLFCSSWYLNLDVKLIAMRTNGRFVVSKDDLEFNQNLHVTINPLAFSLGIARIF